MRSWFKNFWGVFYLLLLTGAFSSFTLTPFAEGATEIVAKERNKRIDSDGDGIPDSTDEDDDNDGITDFMEDDNSDGDDACHTAPRDTDGDGIPDYRDIDSDNDGILDLIEAQVSFGFISPSGQDSDRNGLDDSFEQLPGQCDGIVPLDSDQDGVPDYLDLDSDNDGIPDNVEGQSTFDYLAPSGKDSDKDGLDNNYDGYGNYGISPLNTDGTDDPDFRDTDSDNDLVPDNNEGNDFNFDGIADWIFQDLDSDGDGLDDGYEGSEVNDGYDVNDEIEIPSEDLPDTDGTEDVNYRDSDDDGDGINTQEEDNNEDGDPTNDDADGDDVPDYLDPDPLLVPEALNDTFDIQEDSIGLLDLLANDLDVPTTGTLNIANTPLNGVLTINQNDTPENPADDTVTYVPDANFSGNDSFTYTLCDANGICSTATVSITVTPVNDTPLADDQSVNTAEDTSLDITLLGSDVDGDALTYEIATAPAHGSVTLLGDTATYTPDANYHGADSFTFTVSDGALTSSAATVSITVTPVNDTPLADDQSVSTAEDT
ncbi:MAG: hypothetical protein RLZZ241_2243, partial [Bacteroidota bacterium]